MKKKFRDLTIGEILSICSSNESCHMCPLRVRNNTKYPICNVLSYPINIATDTDSDIEIEIPEEIE